MRILIMICFAANWAQNNVLFREKKIIFVWSIERIINSNDILIIIYFWIQLGLGSQNKLRRSRKWMGLSKYVYIDIANFVFDISLLPELWTLNRLYKLELINENDFSLQLLNGILLKDDNR